MGDLSGVSMEYGWSVCLVVDVVCCLLPIVCEDCFRLCVVTVLV